MHAGRRDQPRAMPTLATDRRSGEAATGSRALARQLQISEGNAGSRMRQLLLWHVRDGVPAGAPRYLKKAKSQQLNRLEQCELFKRPNSPIECS